MAAEGTPMRAEEALDQIAYLRRIVDQTRFRLSASYPMFFMWGLLWVAGYLGSAWLEEETAGILWSVLVSVGGVASMVLGRRLSASGPRTTLTRSLFKMNVALAVAFVAVIPVAFFGDVDSRAVQAAYPPFAVGLIYILNGIFLGWELVTIGAWIAATALASFAMGTPLKEFWMAGAGGGGLLVTGLLLLSQRKAGR